jgi:hypothetical protein
MSDKLSINIILNNIACCVRFPPIFSIVSAIVALAIVALFILGAFFSGGYISLSAKTIALLIFLAILPTLSTVLKKLGQLIAVIFQSLFATLIVVGYVIWTIGSNALGVWIGFLFCFLLLLFIGSYILELQKKRVLHRLTGTNKYQLAINEAERLESTLKLGILLYLSIPLGVIISIGYGWIMGKSEVAAVVLIVPTTLITASLFLMIMLITSANSMSNSLILLEPGNLEEITVEKNSPSFFKAFVSKLFKLSLPEYPKQGELDYTRALNMTCMVSDLRKLYFYDSIHNSTLLFGFSAATVSFVSSLEIVGSIKWFIGIFLLLLFLFSYIPYSIGQFHLYEEILDAYQLDGLERNNLKKKLKEISPPYPLLEFGTALFASGTVGGLIMFLIIEILKNAAK